MSKFVAKIRSWERVTSSDGDVTRFLTKMVHCDVVRRIEHGDKLFVTMQNFDHTDVDQVILDNPYTTPVTNKGPQHEMFTEVIVENMNGKTTEIIRHRKPPSLSSPEDPAPPSS